MKQGYLFLFLFFMMAGLMPAGLSYGQAENKPSSFGYSVPMQRLQFKLTTSFFYFSMQGRVDMDSAAIVVSEGEQLPYSLYYDQDYTDGPESPIKDLLKKGCQYLFKSGTNKNDLDRAGAFLLSAKKEADRSGNVYWQQAVLSLLGRYYLQTNNATASKSCFTQAVDIARKANNPANLARALANRGTYAGYDDPEKENALHESLDIARQQRDTVGEIEMLTRIYEIDFVQRKFDTVAKQLLHVTELEKSIGFRHIHYNHTVLAYLYSVLGDYGEVFTQCKAAIAIMEANHDYTFSSFIYGRMSSAYSDFDDYDNALGWLSKSMQQEPLNKAKRIWYSAFTNITLNIAKAGHQQQALRFVLNTIRDYPPITTPDKMHVAHVLGYCYHDLNQNDSCKKYYGMMLPYLDSLKNDPAERGNIFSAYMDLARDQLSAGHIGPTEKYFQQAKIFADSADIFNMARIHGIQYKLDSSAGNYFKALNEYSATRILSDSIYNLGKAKQFTILRIQYQLENKNKDIDLLVQKDKAQQATLRQSNLVKKITLAGILVMLLVTGLIYGLYRNIQKRNKEISEKNATLGQLVKEKDWLVKEIHHRVKNNFHIVASLLEIQSSYLKNKDALSAIKESQHRIHSMSIIHQKLYQSETLSTIDMPEYIYELVEYLRESYGIRENVRFELQIEKIELNHAFAITLGLILNEAITNSIKYAFAKTDEGKISISLHHISDSQILLTIADNGRGLPADFNSKLGASMGMELLQGLTDDIGGSFSIENNEGTYIKIIFAYKEMMSGDGSFHANS